MNDKVIKNHKRMELKIKKIVLKKNFKYKLFLSNIFLLYLSSVC